MIHPPWGRVWECIHHKALKREVEKVDSLFKALGEPASPFAELLGAEGEN